MTADDRDTRRLLEAGFRWVGDPLPGKALYEHPDHPERSFWHEDALAMLAEQEGDK